MVKKSVKQSRGLSLRENIWIKVGKQTTKKKWGNRASVGLPWWLSGKESICQCRRHKRCGFDHWVRKIPWSRKWQPTSVFLPGKFHGQRSLVGYSSRGHKRTGQNLETKKQNLSKVLLYSIITKMLRMLTMKWKHGSWQVNSTKN